MQPSNGATERQRRLNGLCRKDNEKQSMAWLALTTLPLSLAAFRPPMAETWTEIRLCVKLNGRCETGLSSWGTFSVNPRRLCWEDPSYYASGDLVRTARAELRRRENMGRWLSKADTRPVWGNVQPSGRWFFLLMGERCRIGSSGME